MNLRDAQYIICVAEERNITIAAQKMFISQPTLSQIIKKTEQDLQTRLFDRSPSGLLLTEAGHIYVETMKQILFKEKYLRRQLQSLPESNHAALNIGLSSKKYISSLPKIVGSFRQMYPDIKLCLTIDSSSTLERKVLNGELEAAIIMIEAKNEAINYTLLKEQNIILASAKTTDLAKKYPNRSAIEISAASKEKFISLSIWNNSRDIQDRLFAAYDINPQVILEINDLDTATKLITTLNAVLICPSANILNDPKLLSTLNYYPLMHVVSNRHLYLVQHKQAADSEPLNAFKKIILDCFSESNKY